jgi:hypothetical protein
MNDEKHKRLAEGEVTGHAHVVTAEDAWVIGTEDERELEAPSGTEVTHEEHGPISLPAGAYVVRRQRECDPDTEEARAVRD